MVRGLKIASALCALLWGTVCLGEETTATEEQEAQEEPPPVRVIGLPVIGYSAQVGARFGVSLQLVNALQRLKFPFQPKGQGYLYGFWSTSGSWMVLGAYKAFLGGDRHRVSGGLGYSHFWVDYYAEILGDLIPLPERSKSFFLGAIYEYNLVSRLYVGPTLRYVFNDTQIFDEGQDETLLDERSHNVSIGATASFDSRDNQLSAYRGVYVTLNNTNQLKALGSTFQYSKLIVNANAYIPMGDERWRVCPRLHYEQAFGDRIPLFALPVVGKDPDLRGYVFGEQTGRVVLTGQVEFRFNVWWRLHLVTFGGLGTATDSWEDMGSDAAPLLWSVGAGFRVQPFPNDRLTLRFDWGRGVRVNQFYVKLREAF